jgi:integrase
MARRPKLGRHLYWRGDVIHGWFWRSDPTAPRGRRQVQRSTETTDPERAAKILAEWEADEADPSAAARRDATLGHAYDLLIANRKALIAQGERSEDSLEFYEFSFRCIFLYAGRLLDRIPAGRRDDDLGDEQRRRLIEVGKQLALVDVGTDRFVQGFTEHRQRQGVARSTIGKNRGLFRSALQRARKEGIWSGDLDDLFEEKFPTIGRAKRVKMTKEQVDRLLAQFDRLPHHRAQVAFALATGAEVRAIERALRKDLSQSPVPLRGTKTPLRARACFIALPWQKKFIELAKIGMNGEGQLAFLPWHNSVRDMALACQRAEIPRVSLHSLRHVFTSWSLSDGISENVTVMALGHRDGRQLAWTYDERSPETIQRRAEEEARQRMLSRRRRAG